MDRLHSSSIVTIGLIRKLLVHVVRDAFYVRFGFRCPKHLHRIRDLSLLQHLLHTNRCWMDLHFSEVASLFEKEENDFEVCLHQPCLVNKWNGPDRMEHPMVAPLSLIFVLVTMALFPRGCDLCSHGILIVGELSTQMNISCADAKGSLEKVLFAFRKQSGRVLKLSISINKFLVFVSVILRRFVVVSVPEQAGSLCYCHQDGKYLKSWNLYQVEQLRLRYKIAPVNSCLCRCISTLNVANKMLKPYYEPGEGWTVPISLFSLREISTGLIRTSLISGSKSSSNLSVLTLIHR